MSFLPPIRARFFAPTSFLGALLCALLLALAPAARAQEARVSLGVAGGAQLPLSVSDRFAPRFERTDSPQNSGPTYLVHQRPKVAMNLQLEALIRTMFIRYRFSRGGWGDDRIRCAPDASAPGSATRLPSGDFDDRSINYDCGVDRERMDANPDRRARNSHQILVGVEVRAIVPWRIIPYGSIGGGLALTQYTPAEQSSAVRFGLTVIGGGGLLFPIDRNISVYFETHYALTLMSRGGNYSLRAGRAVAADRSVLSAVIDPLHALDFTLGVRFRIR